MSRVTSRATTKAARTATAKPPQTTAPAVAKSATKNTAAPKPAAPAKSAAPLKSPAPSKTAAVARRPETRPAPGPAKPADAAARARAAGRDQAMAAVDHALDLLDALSRLSPTPIARLESATGCAHATVLRLLAALEARGLAVHGETDDLWRVGPRWSVMQRAAQSQGALAAACMPFMTALGRATGENIYLRVRDGLESETIAVYQADPVLRVYTEAGSRGALHAGPARLLLAHAPEPIQTQVLSQRLQRFTPATRIDPIWIAADLQRLRTRGYLITSDEVNAGAASVSAPVRDASGQVVAILILSAPSMRLRPPRPRQLLPQVLEAAAQISRALGGPVVPSPVLNGGLLPERSAASVPTAPPSPAAWMR